MSDEQATRDFVQRIGRMQAFPGHTEGSLPGIGRTPIYHPGINLRVYLSAKIAASIAGGVVQSDKTYLLAKSGGQCSMRLMREKELASIAEDAVDLADALIARLAGEALVDHLRAVKAEMDAKKSEGEE